MTESDRLTLRLLQRAALLLALLASACVRQLPPAPVVPGNGIDARGQPAAPAPHPDTIVVGAGETLYGVARRYDVPIRSLIEANNLQPPFRLLKGQRLVVPQVRTYTLQPGETLNAVSRRFGVDVSTLAATNHLAPPYPVHAGEVLILPAPVQSASASAPAPVDGSATVEQSQTPAPAPLIVAQPLVPPPAKPEPVPPQSAGVAPPQAVAPSPLPAAPAPPAAQQQVAALPPIVPPSTVPPPGPHAEPPHTGLGFQWPVRGAMVVGYGPGASGTQNDGINIAATRGTAVAAANDGVVAYAGNELRGFGNLILIKHAGGWTTAYAHCETLRVKRGDRVKRGQIIATVGQTGTVTEPQLHFEIRQGAHALDPTSYLPPDSAATAQ